jgi:hypothetical protein
MDTKTKTILLWSGVAVLVVAGIVAIFLSFGGSKDTTVDDVNVIYTNAAATVAAQQQTLQAGTFVATPTVSVSTPTAATSTLLPSSTQQQTPVVLPTIKPPVGTVVTGCDNSVYISDVTIPDGTVIPAGQSFTKTWKVSNSGSCAWTATYQLVFIAGDSLGGKATAIGIVVSPGQAADVSVVLTSTSATGTIQGTWKLSNDKGQPFGTPLTVVISNGVTKTATVGAATTTPTPTPTTIAYPN